MRSNMVQAVKNSWATFKSIFTGMGITGRHLVGPTVTLQYPEERATLPKNARARLFVNMDDCIGCTLCAKACPVNCIDIETVPTTADVDLGKTSTGNPKRFWLTRFNIDMAKCMYCDLCVHPCPTNCIYMEQEYEYSEYDRSNLLYKFSQLSPVEVDDVKAKAEAEAIQKQKEKEEKARQKAEEARLKKEQEAAEKARAADDGTGAVPAADAAKAAGTAAPDAADAARVAGTAAKPAPGSPSKQDDTQNPSKGEA